MRLWLRVHVLFVPGCFQPSRGWIERDGADGGPQIGATFLCCAFLSVTYLKHELLGCHGWPCKAHLWLCYKGVDGGTNARKKGLSCLALRGDVTVQMHPVLCANAWGWPARCRTRFWRSQARTCSKLDLGWLHSTWNSFAPCDTLRTSSRG